MIRFFFGKVNRIGREKRKGGKKGIFCADIDERARAWYNERSLSAKADTVKKKAG